MVKVIRAKRKYRKSFLFFPLSVVSVFLVAAYTFVYANPEVTTLTWPNVPVPSIDVYAHGDNSVTAATDGCGSMHNNLPGSSNSIATVNTDGETSITTKDTDGWRAHTCNAIRVVGKDSTIYFVQRQLASPQAYRITAKRDGIILWTKTILYCNQSASISNLTLGFDGNLYAFTQGSCGSPMYKLLALNASTGIQKFEVDLPTTTGYAGDRILPYTNGLAVVHGPKVYYYSYTGALDPSKTFDPSTPSGASTGVAAIAPEGRTYLSTSAVISGNTVHALYYKDLSSSTIHTVTLPSSIAFAPYTLYPTPAGGFVVKLTKFDSTNNQHLVYFDSTASVVYEKNLSSEPTGYSVGNINVAVDSSGYAVVVRTMQMNTSPSDQNVFVDTFSPIGTQTRIFDSAQTFGTAGRDVFATSRWSSANLGEGRLYLALCHQTWGTLSDCSEYANPRLLSIPRMGGFDYPRSAIFDNVSGKLNYVALGDSFSAGEGLPPFIPPSDTNGCNRSGQSYPALLANDPALNLDLRAFQACSGATSLDMLYGTQRNSLDSDTDVVTLTIGGNDIGFPDFARQCVIGTCDFDSSEYTYALNAIDTSLQERVEDLLTSIALDATTAEIYVVGYPQVAPAASDYTPGSCNYYLSDGERIAARGIVSAMNAKIATATQNSGSNFIFVNPAATNSPFPGNEACTAGSYFFGLNILEHRFSFHPNIYGQQAYYQLVSTVL